MSNAEQRAVRESTSIAGPGSAGANPLIATVSRLIPRSGIQFIDLRIDASALSATRGRFVEDDDPDHGPLLVPLVEQPDKDGIEWHPITDERLGPNQALWLSGHDALEPFLGSWIPLPYFRFLGRNEDGEPRFDVGPANWARLYVERPQKDLRDIKALKAVLAIDTQVDSRSRIEQSDYVAPNLDDVVFAPTFKLATDSIHLDDFLSAQWFDAWLTRLFTRYEADRGKDASKPAGHNDARTGDPITLERVARYLTLLNVLDIDTVMPQLQFVDVRSAHWRTRHTAVDLLLDIDSPDTEAAIIASGESASPDRGKSSEPLRIRDLSRPTLTHTGPFRTLAEFAAPNFGDDRSSMLSGRSNAFFWPSLVRVGTEGLRLSNAASAAPGQTGLHSLLRGLRQTAPLEGVWRFGHANGEAEEAGSMVSGLLLSHIAEDGAVIGACNVGDVVPAPALRPHFSPSSIISMFVAECLLHAIAQINDPNQVSANAQVQRLNRVLLTCPFSAPPDERELLKKRVEDALDLIWTAFGWTDDDAIAPPRPEVVLHLDAGLSAQVAFLHDEIQNRYAGSARQFVSLLGRSGNGKSNGLRIAALDISGHASSLSIVNYRLGAEGQLIPEAEMADRTDICGDSLTEAVTKAHILPAIATALEAAGHPNGVGLISRLGNSLGSEGVLLGRHFSARFLRKVLMPAASALIDVHQAMVGTIAGTSARRLTIDRLVRLGDGRMGPLDKKFESLAAAGGARNFRLGAVGVNLRSHEFSQTMSKHLRALLQRASEAIRLSGADVLILNGHYAELAEVKGLLHQQLPLAPHRIISMNSRVRDDAEDGDQADAAGTRMATLVRASQCSFGTNGQFNRIGAVASELKQIEPPRAGRAAFEKDTREGDDRAHFSAWDSDTAQALGDLSNEPAVSTGVLSLKPDATSTSEPDVVTEGAE